MNSIKSLEELRAMYGEAKGRAVTKQLSSLEKHSIRFINLAPFIVMSTVGREGKLDTSPRGGSPGFVKVFDEFTIGIPDYKGNNRLDSLVNILETGQVGLLFVIPGVDESLRVNGKASICNDSSNLQAFEFLKAAPKTYIKIDIEEVFLHCAKAFMRSQLWQQDQQLERSSLPTMGKMLQDQTGCSQPIESQQAMIERYSKDL